MLLSAIGHREVPIPEHIDIYHLSREMAPSEKTALYCVMEVDEQRIMLEKEAERLAHEDCEFNVMYPAITAKGKCILYSCVVATLIESKCLSFTPTQPSVRSCWSCMSVWRSWMLTRQRCELPVFSTAWVLPLLCSGRNSRTSVEDGGCASLWPGTDTVLCCIEASHFLFYFYNILICGSKLFNTQNETHIKLPDL